jgi:hypothetical protein
MAGRTVEDRIHHDVARRADEAATQWADASENGSSDIYACWTDCLSTAERDAWRKTVPWAYVQIDLFRGG